MAAPDPNGGFPAPGFSGTMAAAWRLYRGSMPAVAGLFLILAAVANGLYVGARVAAGGAEASPALQLALALFIPIVGFVTAGSLGLMLSGPLFADRLAGRESAFVTSLGTTATRPRSIIAAGLFASVVALCMVAIFTLALTLFLPLFYGPPVVAYVVALEGKTLQEALSRARFLLKGSWLRVLGVLLMTTLGIGLLQGALSQIGYAFPAPGARAAALIALQVAADVIMLPFYAAVSFVLYLDLRNRRDGFGPEELVQERARAHAPKEPRATQD